jgi:hypothetical protein
MPIMLSAFDGRVRHVPCRISPELYLAQRTNHIVMDQERVQAVEPSERSAKGASIMEVDMPILLWLLGIPIPVILLLLLLWH